MEKQIQSFSLYSKFQEGCIMLVLPELAKIPEGALAQVPELFKIFRRDFIDNITYFMAYPVIVPRPNKK